VLLSVPIFDKQSAEINVFANAVRRGRLRIGAHSTGERDKDVHQKLGCQGAEINVNKWWRRVARAWAWAIRQRAGGAGGAFSLPRPL
jgi:hypothetical protein